MPNQLSLKITPQSVRHVLAEVLELSNSSEGHQCLFTGCWTVPEGWRYSAAATLIAWAIKARTQCPLDPIIRLNGNQYASPLSITICVNPHILLAEIRDFLSEPEVLEAEYTEPFMDRVVQPLQLIHNLHHSALNTAEDPGRIADTVEQIYESIHAIAPEFIAGHRT